MMNPAMQKLKVGILSTTPISRKSSQIGRKNIVLIEKKKNAKLLKRVNGR